MSEDKKESIDGIIFNDEKVKSGFIKTPDGRELITPMIFDAPTKSIEEKTYIILWKLYLEDGNGDEFNNVYQILTGRTDTYRAIINMLTSLSAESVDINRSIIITETKQTETSTGDTKYYLLPLNECISVYSFCKSVEEYYSYDDFNIDEYNITHQEDEKVDDSIPRSFTAEEIEFKRMLEASLQQDKFINTYREEHGIGTSNI